MLTSQDFCEMINKGGVLQNIEGTTIEEIYANAIRTMDDFEGLDRKALYSELIKREKVLSTAVGNGVAIPHPKKPIIKDERNQRIVVCFLKDPLKMNSPDGSRVETLFILLTAKTQCHFDALSTLATLVRDKKFKELLKAHPNEWQLCDGIRNTLEIH